MTSAYQRKDDISLSEGSTVDLRKPGEEEDDYSELEQEAMDPENCFPEGVSNSRPGDDLMRPASNYLNYRSHNALQRSAASAPPQCPVQQQHNTTRQRDE
ncbi:hypothetical protein WMY93_033741 [Mugilogobius chulae]|uniref:Sodium ion transport-associated domain-containing protein n=1 Tax=Mugilogobius chulae TaxID=88201 RepID=A0AAW0MRX3_9GOBI